MGDNRALYLLVSFCAGLMVGASLAAAPAKQIEPARLFADHMVLQQNRDLPIWGTANPGGEVTVAFRGQIKRAVADAGGDWRVVLEPVAAGGPFKLTIGGETTLTLRDVRVGEVWLCSGQSNMALAMTETENADAAIAAADVPEIRLFTVPTTIIEGGPHTTLSGGEWKVCSPATVSRFSAVAYYFGLALHAELQVPIGLIHASRGGSPAAPWIDRRALSAVDELKPIVDRYERVLQAYPPIHDAFLEKEAQWSELNQRVGEPGEPIPDPGDTGHADGFAQFDFDDSAWHEFTFRVPRWTGGSVVWFRKRFNSDPLGSTTANIRGLQLVGAYQLFLNGEPLAASSDVAPHRIERENILLNSGENLLALRVFSDRQSGALNTFPAFQSARRSENRILLGGDWRYKASVTHNTIPFELVAKEFPPLGPLHPGGPGNLFGNMIHPLAPYALRGVVWYQGESDVRGAARYPALLNTLIESWRALWGQGDFPFLIVQLANYHEASVKPAESTWAELREAQAMALQWPHTGLVTAIDVGDADNIHPRDKRTVGERLALSARGVAYGQDVVHSGPMYASMTVEGDTIMLSFTNIGSGLVARDGPLRQFAIAGADKTFVWANARIIGDRVAVHSETVAAPVAVRYAWSDNPEGCNLYNREGLPAVPFRTDRSPE